MRLGSEIELPRLAHAAHLDVIRFAFAHRHRFMRQVGNAGQQLAKAVFESLLLFFERRHARLGSADGLLFGGGVEALPLHLPDLLALRIALRLELLGFRDRRPPLLVQFPELFQAGARAARGQAGRNRIKIVTDVCEIEHFPPC